MQCNKKSTFSYVGVKRNKKIYYWFGKISKTCGRIRISRSNGVINYMVNINKNMFDEKVNHNISGPIRKNISLILPNNFFCFIKEYFVWRNSSFILNELQLIFMMVKSWSKILIKKETIYFNSIRISTVKFNV